MANNPFVPQTATSTSSGGSRWITNPKHMSVMSAPQGMLTIKTSIAGSNNPASGGFFTSLALRGAQTSITVADTYATIASLSGAGFLVGVMSPTHSASFTPSIRITVDGVAYTFTPSAAQTAGNRLYVGPLLGGTTSAIPATASVAGDFVGPNSAADSGFTTAMVGGVAIPGASSVLGIPTPEAALSAALNVLRFEFSCVIETKCSLLSATANDKLCGAVYRMDI